MRSENTNSREYVFCNSLKCHNFFTHSFLLVEKSQHIKLLFIHYNTFRLSFRGDIYLFSGSGTCYISISYIVFWSDNHNIWPKNPN